MDKDFKKVFRKLFSFGSWVLWMRNSEKLFRSKHEGKKYILKCAYMCVFSC